jgi:hypothetical protein
MTQQDFRDYIKFLSRCIPYYEKGFLLELKRVWLIKSFWKERIFELMRDDIAFSKLAIELVRKALPSYKLNGIDGLKYHLKDTYQVSDIHYALLKVLKEDCRKL